MNDEKLESETSESRPGAEGSRQPLSPEELVRLAFRFYLPFLLFALLWMAWQGRLDQMFWSGGAGAGLRALTMGAVAGAVTVLFSRWVTRAFAWGRALEDAFREMLGGIGPADAVMLALFSALAEEAVFRGALQPEVGLVWASLLFGLVHFPLERRLFPWTPFAVAIGFVFGVLFERTGGLAAPVLAHFLINAINLAWIGSSARSHGTIHTPGA